jgi:serine/threonine protein kinase
MRAVAPAPSMSVSDGGTVLGQGANGVVTVERDCNGFLVAVKRVGLHQASTHARALFEGGLLMRTQHPNVVRALSCVVRDNPACVEIVLEHAGVSLIDCIESISEVTRLRDIFRQICHGVQYLHSHYVAHRDLKLDNVCMDTCGRVRLIDLGLAEHCLFSPYVSSVAGSVSYAAPEMWGSGAVFDVFATDVWSLGIVLSALLWKRTLFSRTIRHADARFDAYVAAVEGGLPPSHALRSLPGCTDLPAFEPWAVVCFDKTLWLDPTARRQVAELA